MGERISFTFIAPMQIPPDVEFEKMKLKKEKRIEMNQPIPDGPQLRPRKHTNKNPETHDYAQANYLDDISFDYK